MPRTSASDAARAVTPERLAHELEELELSPYQARILLALLRLGSANTVELAKASQVPRTSIYTNLEELSALGLAERLPVNGPARWRAPEREEVFASLAALQEEKLRAHRERLERLREMVAKALPEEAPQAGPYVRILQRANQISHAYDGLLGRAERELLVCNRPPYSVQGDYVNPAVLETVQRGVAARALYERDQWHRPDSESFREAMAVYHEAGVEGRLVDELPLKLAIVDRDAALLTMADPVQPDIGFPTTLLIEHPGCAEFHADAFEALWARGEPLNKKKATRPRKAAAKKTTSRRAPSGRSARTR